ncbi:hypothetical protein [Agromyces sp. GXS1127]|uniref:hypothetical protein n=1 Tax=Agromyces sp. GXS1127 TaxID=3424181 RepID=UPI003D3111F9
MTENSERPTTTGPTAPIETDATGPLFAEPADAAAPVADSVYAASAAGDAAGAGADPTTRPTIRWGALVWALVFGGTAALTLWILVDPTRQVATAEWLTTLSPFAAALYALIAVGVLVALFGIVGLIRRGERARAPQDASTSPADGPRTPVHHGARRA